MKTMTVRALLPLTVCAFLAAASCLDEYVSIPSADKDKAPQLTIGASPLSGTGSVKDPELTFSEVYSPSGTGIQVRRTTVTEGTQVNFMLSALNPGGVKILSVQIQGPQEQLYSVINQAVPRADGKVPTQLIIMGHNDQGGPGNKPLHVTFTKDNSIIVTATAENYNNGRVTARVAYDVIPK